MYGMQAWSYQVRLGLGSKEFRVSGLSVLQDGLKQGQSLVAGHAELAVKQFENMLQLQGTSA